MASPIKVSEAASLALHAAALMAGAGESNVSAARMAERLGASEAHLGKVLQRLVKAGLARSIRGPGGGYALARAPEEISLKEIYEVVEGPLKDGGCLFGFPLCGKTSCPLGDLFRAVHEEIATGLASTTLEDYKIAFAEGAEGR